MKITKLKIHNKAIKNGPQKDVGRTAFYAASYGKRYVYILDLE